MWLSATLNSATDTPARFVFAEEMIVPEVLAFPVTIAVSPTLPEDVFLPVLVPNARLWVKEALLSWLVFCVVESFTAVLFVDPLPLPLLFIAEPPVPLLLVDKFELARTAVFAELVLSPVPIAVLPTLPPDDFPPGPTVLKVIGVSVGVGVGVNVGAEEGWFTFGEGLSVGVGSDGGVRVGAEGGGGEVGCGGGGGGGGAGGAVGAGGGVNKSSAKTGVKLKNIIDIKLTAVKNFLIFFLFPWGKAFAEVLASRLTYR